MLDAEGPEQSHLDDADLFALGREVVDGLVSRIHARAHQDNYFFGIGCSEVVEQTIAPADDFLKSGHRLGDDLGCVAMELVDGFTALEVNIRVLSGAADGGSVGRKRPCPVRRDEVLVDHGSHVVERQFLDLLHLVAVPESVEEVQKRYPRR